MRYYPIIIHKDEDSDYGVTVPDLPGCFSAGSTIDEAMAMVQEAIVGHIAVLIDEGEPVPEATSIERHKNKRQYRGGVWAVVSIDLEHLPIKSRRINITMPERLLEALDRVAAGRDETRSGLIAQAVIAYIQQSKSSGRRRSA